MVEFKIRLSGKKCWSRLDVGGREKHGKMYTGLSLIEPKEGRETVHEKNSLVFLGYNELERIFSLVEKPGELVEK